MSRIKERYPVAPTREGDGMQLPLSASGAYSWYEVGAVPVPASCS